MILIADSGSSKTHWACVAPDGVRETVTQGLNPHFSTDEAFEKAFRSVKELLPPEGQSQPTIWFYGAGCGTATSVNRVKSLIEASFTGASAQVAGDLIGACRASCGSEPGLVGILGTGSNMCYYDGRGIARKRVSTGYVLGDEGSGNHIGRRLLKDYLEERMPEEISTLFHGSYPISTDEMLDRLYHHPNPNRFLASFAPFAACRQDHPYIQSLLNDCFDDFFQQTDYYSDLMPLALHLVGGLVANYSCTLQQAAGRHGITLAPMIQDPIPGLIQFHSR